jgi:hypothetical protein
MKSAARLVVLWRAVTTFALEIRWRARRSLKQLG